MLEKYELGHWFHDTFGFRLVYLPYAAIPILIGSLVLPLLAWWLQHLRLISAGTQRIAEIAWLVMLALVVTIGWGMWTVDYCDRIHEDHFAPFTAGIFVGIAIGVLSVFGIRQWRVNKCLVGKSLMSALLVIAAHSVLFYACLIIVGIVGLVFITACGGSLALAFLPTWAQQVYVLLAFALYLLSVVWAIPAIRRWK